MKIELKCRCGAQATWTDERGAYAAGVNGHANARGFRYLIEERADEWQERHKVCLLADAKTTLTGAAGVGAGDAADDERFAKLFDFGKETDAGVLGTSETVQQARDAAGYKIGPLPNLWPVIQWLEGGCNPLEAAKELRIYAERINANDVAVVAPAQSHAVTELTDEQILGIANECDLMGHDGIHIAALPFARAILRAALGVREDGNG